METDSIITLIALNTRLKTSNGATPQLTAGELWKLYPNELWHQSLVDYSEALIDSINGWWFTIETNSSNQIAE